MKGILEKIVKLREHSQIMDDECGAPIVSNKKVDASPKVTAEIFFRTAQTFNECRVCLHLQLSGNYSNLFDNHIMCPHSRFH